MVQFQIKIGMLLLLLLGSAEGLAQSAKEWFMQANDDFMYARYEPALEKLQKAEALLGRTNPKIQSVKAQILFNQGKVVEAKVEIEKYFKLVSMKYMNTAGHQAMVQLKKSIDAALENEEKAFEEKKQQIAQEGLEEAKKIEASIENKTKEKEENRRQVEDKKLYDLVSQSKDKEALETYMKYFGEKSSNISEIKTEIKKFTSPDEFLYQAVYTNNRDETEHLLKNGGNANHSTNGNYLVHIATERTSIGMLDLLNEYGASFEKTNGQGYTPIMLAVVNKLSDQLDYFIEKEVNLEARSASGYTPLLLAVYNGMGTYVEKLKLAGANIQVKNNSGEGALQISYQQNNPNTFTYLLNFLSPNENFTNAYSPLYNIVSARKHTFLDAILKAGANSNALQKNGWYALHYASYLGDEYAVQQLLAYRADPNLKGPYDWTPLHYAAKHNYIGIANMLVNAGADKRQKDIYNRSAKRVAREYKNRRVF